MLWRVLQAGAVLLTIFLFAAFLMQPADSLHLFWNFLIPLLPATFLITPIIWRSLCPVASLNMVGNGKISRLSLAKQTLPKVGTAGIILLVLMVPARRFLFNENALALAITVLIVAVLAVALGMIFNVRAGFCNSICPILPVEKLYGQHPIWEMKNPRCATCSLCTPKGCVDLAPRKSMSRALGNTVKNSHNWLRTSYGIFAAAFPGFILGYFTTPDVSFIAAGFTYLHVLALAGGSYLLTTCLVWLLNAPAKYVLPLLGAIAIGLYYWFAAPLMLSTFALTGSLNTLVLRTAIFAFIGFWLGRALYKVSLQPEFSAVTQQIQASPR